MFKSITASSPEMLAARMNKEHELGSVPHGFPLFADGKFHHFFVGADPAKAEVTTVDVHEGEEPLMDPLEATYGKAEAAAWRLSRTGPREYLMEQVGILMDLAEGGNFSVALDIHKALIDKYQHSVNELVREFPELDALVFGLLGRRPGGSRGLETDEAALTHVKGLVADLRKATQIHTPTPPTNLLKRVLDVPECEYNKFKRERDAGTTEAGAPESTADRLVRADEEIKGVKTPADVLNLILGAVHEGSTAVAIYCARQLTGRDTVEIYKSASVKYRPHLDNLIFGLIKRDHSSSGPSRVEQILEDLYAAHPEFRPTISLTKQKK